MRKDYDYVKKATDLCLTTTTKGDELNDELVHEIIEQELRKPDPWELSLIETLNYLQNYYVSVESEEPLNVWYDALVNHYTEEFGCTHCGAQHSEPPTPYTYFKRMWTKGLLTVKLVIWDE